MTAPRVSIPATPKDALVASAPRTAVVLSVRTWRLVLRVRRGGCLLAWSGPALRGIVAGRLKASVCRHSPVEREQRWRYCKGCPHQTECTYARLYEPLPPTTGVISSDRADGTPPLVLAPYYPLWADQTVSNQNVAAGLEIPLRVVIAGRSDKHDFGRWLAALCSAGDSPGLGPDHVTFDVLPVESQPEETALDPSSLPVCPDAGGMLPRVGIGLLSPLLLRHTDDTGQRHAVHQPTLSDLFNAAIGTIRTLVVMDQIPFAPNLAALREAAARVLLLDHCYEPFEQVQWSNRGGARTWLRGVIGGGIYGDVPLACLPWLIWAGRLHVGNRRVAGAGGWRIILD